MQQKYKAFDIILAHIRDNAWLRMRLGAWDALHGTTHVVY